MDWPLPIVICAPMAGGPSTVALAAAVGNAGGLGFLAAGYVTGEAMAAQVGELRACTSAPFGVNVFVVHDVAVDQRALDAYVTTLQPDADRLGVEVGNPRFADDGFDAKLAALLELRVPVVSFTFACPPAAVVAALQAVGTRVWVTVSTVADARIAAATGCDALVLQGIEAGGHRGAFDDDGGLAALDTLALLTAVRAEITAPLIAAGGVMSATDTRAMLDGGAAAVQAGTAFLLTPEAGTTPVHRAAIGSDAPTALTRAFTGRTARGITNAFMERHTDAPVAYPQIHHATAPLRAAARAAGDVDGVNLWAGTRHGEARAVPAAQVVARLTP